MNFIFITYNAIAEFAPGRFFQSAEYLESSMPCDVSQRASTYWEHNETVFQITEKGCFFYTYKLDKKQGSIFDLPTFRGFRLSSREQIVSMFQKTVEYTIRYFEKLPVATCERLLPGLPTTIVFPFPSTATKDVNKIPIDRNSSKQDRKGRNYLAVYSFGNDGKTKVSFTNLSKALGELDKLQYSPTQLNTLEPKISAALAVTDLSPLNLPIDLRIGYDNWQYYLTESQKSFVTPPINGAERLEDTTGAGRTLSMILKCTHLLKEKIEKNEEYHIISVAHSLATEGRIIDIFLDN